MEITKGGDCEVLRRRHHAERRLRDDGEGKRLREKKVFIFENGLFLWSICFFFFLICVLLSETLELCAFFMVED